MFRTLITLMLLFFWQSCSADALSGEVIRIVDGNTLVIMAEHRPQTILLAGIAAPERVQPFGNQARSNLARIAFQKRASAVCARQVRNQPRLCKVWVDGHDIGLRQIQAGMAWHLAHPKDRRLPDHDTYAQAENMAKMRRFGLWSASRPVPPWDWRKLNP